MLLFYLWLGKTGIGLVGGSLVLNGKLEMVQNEAGCKYIEQK